MSNQSKLKKPLLYGLIGSVLLLSIAKLASRFRWIYFIACQIIYGYALLLCGVIVGEVDSSSIWRLIAALSIMVAAISLVIPILNRISRMEPHGTDLLGPLEQRSIAFRRNLRLKSGAKK